jgi:hypothetical protein
MLVKILQERDIALLSQEGSGIAKRIPRGVVPKLKRFVLGTTPALRATPPDSGGVFFLSPIPPYVPDSQQ